ncbi:extracellular solute-binding protein [Paenibacillus contaminans]|uniref:ABC transporter substrate-binding protein n=1 Tax=Paenibacillus contaminans TaxID=450362 RepID=A0A329MH34_9BACL|nr:extracellular solute-binding protein [Paenibacillus contaminans]RAV19002.1 hypothetical protein DQG23_22925 [Paenibacillus contaminans]
MKSIKIGSAALLSLALVLTACSKEKETDTPAKQTGGASQSPSADVKPQKEKLSLNWLVHVQANTNLPEAGKDFVKKKIEEKFNVELKLDYMISGQDYINKTNALLASTPPDMWKDGTPDGGNQYAVSGLLADMTPFVSPQTMPNYFKYWTTEKEMKLYQVQNNFYRAPVPFDRSIFRSLYIRKDWLDKLGLPVPKTYDEYVETLRKFRNGDPDGNGKKDTYGFTTAGAGGSIGLDWPEYLKHGLTFPRKIENDRFVDIQTDPKIEFVINDVAKLIQEDLVDPDWYLNKAPQHVEKAISGKAGVVLGATKDFAFDSNPQSIQARTKQLFPNANWVPLNLFPDTPAAVKPSPANPFLFAKTVAEKNPEKVKRSIEILDWLASEEGYLLTHYGEEGKHYVKEGQTIKLNVDAYTNDIAKQGDFLKIWQFFTPFEAPQIFGLTVLDSRMTDHDREITKYFTTIKLNENEGTSLIPPQGFDLAGFRKRQAELQTKALLEDKSGKNWPQYREELMTKYKGNELFESYEKSLRAVGAIK